jgi:hypothetical protein
MTATLLGRLRDVFPTAVAAPALPAAITARPGRRGLLSTTAEADAGLAAAS